MYLVDAHVHLHSCFDPPEFLDAAANNNPHAMLEMTEKLVEAMQRGLWQNPGEYKEKMETLLIDLDNLQEQA